MSEEKIKDETTEIIKPSPDDDKTTVVEKPDDKKSDDKKADDKKSDDKDDKGALSDAEKNLQAIQNVLNDHDLDSPEQLKDLLERVADRDSKLGDNDLEELIENSELLKTYQKQWEKQEDRKREDDETPEETISRLKKEKKEIAKAAKADEDRRNEADDSKRALKTFNSTVKSAVESNKDVPKEYRPFLNEFMGVDNPINEVDLTDKAAIKKISKDAAKKLIDFEQVIIKRYRDGKAKIPKISSSAETSSDAPVKITKDNERAIATEMITGRMKK